MPARVWGRPGLRVEQGPRRLPAPSLSQGRTLPGLSLWQGEYEDTETLWLRWTDHDGRLIPTGAELARREHQRATAAEHQAEQERQRAEQERQRAERLAARLRDLGIEPDE